MRFIESFQRFIQIHESESDLPNTCTNPKIFLYPLPRRPIAEDANDANLIVEVWDFDPAETVKEKMNKLFEVKGVRGLRKLKAMFL